MTIRNTRRRERYGIRRLRTLLLGCLAIAVSVSFAGPAWSTRSCLEGFVIAAFEYDSYLAVWQTHRDAPLEAQLEALEEKTYKDDEMLEEAVNERLNELCPPGSSLDEFVFHIEGRGFNCKRYPQVSGTVRCTLKRYERYPKTKVERWKKKDPPIHEVFFYYPIEWEIKARYLEGSIERVTARFLIMSL